jgi:hypothetical protein
MKYEGGAMEGGRGPSIWDTFTHQHPGMYNHLYLSVETSEAYTTHCNINHIKKLNSRKASSIPTAAKTKDARACIMLGCMIGTFLLTEDRIHIAF